jgi:hypothetical protein
MPAEPTFIKLAAPVAVPSALGEIGLSSAGLLTWFDGASVQTVSTGGATPTLVPDNTVYSIPDLTQVMISMISLDGDLALDGYLVEV